MGLLLDRRLMLTTNKPQISLLLDTDIDHKPATNGPLVRPEADVDHKQAANQPPIRH